MYGKYQCKHFQNLKKTNKTCIYILWWKRHQQDLTWHNVWCVNIWCSNKT